MSNEVSFDLLEATNTVCRKIKFGWNFVGLEDIDSTNNYSKEHTDDFDDPTIIVAKHQTEGKGRGGKTWEDEGGGTAFLSTWFSFLDIEPDPRWTLGLGLYVYESLAEAFPSLRTKLSLKAPNDIFLGDRKLAGVLVEATQNNGEHYIHVGIGINVFGIPLEQTATATSLQNYLGQITPEAWQDFIELFGTTLFHLEKRINKDTDEWLRKISGRLKAALNKNPAYADNPITAIEADGSLTLEKGKISWQDL